MTPYEIQSRREALQLHFKSARQKINCRYENDKRYCSHMLEMDRTEEELNLKAEVTPLYEHRRNLRADIHQARRDENPHLLEKYTKQLDEINEKISSAKNKHFIRLKEIKSDYLMKMEGYTMSKISDLTMLEENLRKQLAEIDALARKEDSHE